MRRISLVQLMLLVLLIALIVGMARTAWMRFEPLRVYEILPATDGESLVAVYSDDRSILWEIGAGPPADDVVLEELLGPVPFGFTDDRHLLCLDHSTATLVLKDVRTGDIAEEPDLPFPFRIRQHSFKLANDRRLVWSSDGFSIMAQDLRTGTTTSMPLRLSRRVYHRFLYITSASADECVVRAPTEDSVSLVTYAIDGSKSSFKLPNMDDVFATHRRLIALVRPALPNEPVANSLSLTDTRSGKELWRVNCSSITEVKFDRDGSRLVGLTRDHTGHDNTMGFDVFDAETGKPIARRPCDTVGSTPTNYFDRESFHIIPNRPLVVITRPSMSAIEVWNYETDETTELAIEPRPLGLSALYWYIGLFTLGLVAWSYMWGRTIRKRQIDAELRVLLNPIWWSLIIGGGVVVVQGVFIALVPAIDLERTFMPGGTIGPIKFLHCVMIAIGMFALLQAFGRSENTCKWAGWLLIACALQCNPIAVLCGVLVVVLFSDTVRIEQIRRWRATHSQ